MLGQRRMFAKRSMSSNHHKPKQPQPARPERLLPKANAKIRVNILYDDGHVLALDKPIGLSTQPGRGHIDDTLVNAAFATHGEALCKLGADRDWGLLHRLDMDVGGVVLMGLTDIGYDNVRAQFEDRTIAKKYLAIAHNAPPADTGRCTRALTEVIRGDMKVSVNLPRGGEDAQTRWKVLSKSKTHCLLEVELIHTVIPERTVGFLFYRPPALPGTSLAKIKAIAFTPWQMPYFIEYFYNLIKTEKLRSFRTLRIILRIHQTCYPL